jgi:vancomycin resistance protein YoaR
MNWLKLYSTSFVYQNKWRRRAIIVLILILAITVGAFIGATITYNNKFLPNTYIGVVNIGNRDRQQAEKIVTLASQNLLDHGLILQTADKQNKVVITSILASSDPDLATTLFTIDVPTTIANAWQTEKQLSPLKKFIRIFIRKNYEVIKTINEKSVTEIIKNTFSVLELPAKPLTINFSRQPAMIVNGATGKEIDSALFVNKISQQIANLDNQPITILSKPTPAPLNSNQILPETINKINALAKNKPILELKYKNITWPWPFSAYSRWLSIKVINNQQQLVVDNGLSLAFWKQLEKEINQPAQNARFAISNGRVKEFQASGDGQILNIDASLSLINNQLNQENFQPVELVVAIEKAAVSNQDTNNLGIKEMIGLGQSNFKGSPKNRRHNIAVGAKTLNGLLINPGEDFSLVKALGEIDALNGYLPELVIKGNQTLPEFGGGLCQIGTTVFRAALNSGLPILERRNHSYRVRYYEPAGTDATIYNPKPDLRFKNDTNSYILIQTHINNDDLFIEFWGTKDGRIVQQSKSIISNIVSPGEAQMIETNQLRPGEKKCIEEPHAGADAHFDYKVVYSNGEEKNQRFSSHYIPWTKKCLIGKSATSTTDVIISSTSTPPLTPTSSTLTN